MVRSESAAWTSDITWTVYVPDIDATSPGRYDIATPTPLRIEFSGPVDQKSVEAALLKWFAESSKGSGSMEIVWTGDRTARLSVEAYNWVEISPQGGFDAAGRPLKETDSNWLTLCPGKPLSLWLYWPGQPDRSPKRVASLGQPYTVYSVSPGGDRMLLWLQAVHGPVACDLDPGRFYVWEVAQGEPVALSEEGEGGRYRLLPDGTLACDYLLLLPSPRGDSPAWTYAAPAVAGPGGQAMRWVEAYRGSSGERVFSADGSKAAQAAVIDLSTGAVRTVDGISAKPSPSECCDDYRVDAAVSQDGRYLAFSDYAPTADDCYAFNVWLADMETGEKRIIATEARGSLSWSPSGDALLISGTGVVDITDRVNYACADIGSWAPSGDVLWVRDTGLVRVSDWVVLNEIKDETWSLYWDRFAWSPDGSKFAVRFPGSDLVVSAEGRELWGDGPSHSTLSWSKDGRSLAIGSVVLSFADDAAQPTVTEIDLSFTGDEVSSARVVGWCGDALLVATGGRR